MSKEAQPHSGGHAEHGYSGGHHVHSNHSDPHGSGHSHANASDNSKKTWIFVGIIAVLLVLIIAFVQTQEAIFSNLFWIALLVFAVYIFSKFQVILELKDFERAVVYRFGRFNKVAGPGWTFLVPVTDSFTRVDLRVQTIDIHPQEVITTDEVELVIDAVIYLRVKSDKDSVLKSVVAVDDYKQASRLYVIALIRDVVGSLTMKEVISKIEDMNERLARELAKLSSDWGVEVQAVKLQDVEIPQIVVDAMHEEKAAEQKKLARFEEALAHKKEIEAVKEAAENLSDSAISYYYVKALEKLGEGSSTKFIFPMELSKLASSIGTRIEGKNEDETKDILLRFAPQIKKLLEESGPEKKRKKKK